MPGAAPRGHTALDADVVVIGSGAGGSIAAAKLSAAGARVVIVEEGWHLAPGEFTSDEGQSYARLYQEAAARSTTDGAIRILQGRSVGGGTTVNWMTSLRVPESTLRHWQRVHGVENIDSTILAPHFREIERRLNVHPPEDPDISPSNRILQRGLDALGWHSTRLPRNTRDCTNIGLCGLGCPTDAKRTATLTWIADALDSGASLVSRARVDRVIHSGATASGVEGTRLGPDDQPVGTFAVRARTVVVAGGAINTPALLLRSGFDSPNLGRRTWLHPVFPVLAEYDEVIDPWKGSPQSVASNELLDRGDRMGFFMETPPIYPVNAASVLPAVGARHRELMATIPRSVAIIAICVDGFHRDESGGVVTVDRHDRARLHYPIVARLREAGMAAMTAAARVHLAAGARVVRTLHNDPLEIRAESDLLKIAGVRIRANAQTILSAHPMGGCAMGRDPKTSVVDSRGRSHTVRNLWVCDGSLFPTSLGVNPMLTIYALSSLCADEILRQ